MPAHNEYFNKYVSYFPSIDKQLKLGRNGTILVIDKSNNQCSTYKNWEELNMQYKLFPYESNISNINETKVDHKQKTSSAIKYWAFGHPTRFKELIKKFNEFYNLDENILTGFNKQNWVYYFDSNNSLISTNNSMVIDLLQNSKDWVEYKLPEPRKFTKAEIAGMIGMDIDSFEII